MWTHLVAILWKPHCDPICLSTFFKCVFFRQAKLLYSIHYPAIQFSRGFRVDTPNLIPLTIDDYFGTDAQFSIIVSGALATNCKSVKISVKIIEWKYKVRKIWLLYSLGSHSFMVLYYPQKIFYHFTSRFTLIGSEDKGRWTKAWSTFKKSILLVDFWSIFVSLWFCGQF